MPGPGPGSAELLLIRCRAVFVLDRSLSRARLRRQLLIYGGLSLGFIGYLIFGVRASPDWSVLSAMFLLVLLWPLVHYLRAWFAGSWVDGGLELHETELVFRMPGAPPIEVDLAVVTGIHRRGRELRLATGEGRSLQFEVEALHAEDFMDRLQAACEALGRKIPAIELQAP